MASLDPRERILQVKMEEYRAMRGELDKYMGLIGTILTIGTILVAGELAAGFTVDDKLFAGLALLLIPSTILLITAMLCGVAMNTRAVGNYILTFIEEPVQVLLGEEYRNWLAEAGIQENAKRRIGFVMHFETYERDKTAYPSGWPLIGTVGMVSFILLLGVGPGTWRLVESCLWPPGVALVAIALSIVPVVAGIYFFSLTKRRWEMGKAGVDTYQEETKRG